MIMQTDRILPANRVLRTAYVYNERLSKRNRGLNFYNSIQLLFIYAFHFFFKSSMCLWL